MNIGYACLTVGVPGTDLKSCIMKNAGDERLRELIGNNLDSLEKIIEYNISSGIRLFRISSDLIPFGSSPVNRLPWERLFSDRLSGIGKKIRDGGIRVSMHPGQYTVLNSPDPEVARRAAADLDYHCRLLESLGTGADCKIILHLGGAYGNKKTAIERFGKNFRLLDGRIAERLVIENDDGIFNIADVLETGIELGMPVVFDNLHNFVNPATGAGSDSYWIDCCSTTWRKKDGRQKIHYSQQDPLKKTGSHSSSIRSDEFLRFIEGIGRRDIDMMLEVKDKNLSAVKCINLLAETGKTKALELEWGKYKYKVLEGSPAGYNSIRSLLKDKRAYPAVEFYRLIEESLAVVPSGGHIINAASHVWGYFKDKANGKEKNEFARLTEGLTEGSVKPVAIRKFLYRMTQKYDEKYLMDSYYFIDQ